jgi:hypothetical protein
VVEQREGGRVTGQHPVGGHDVGRQLPPRAEAGAADAVLTERRKVPEVRGGVAPEQFQVGQRDPLDEHRYAVDVHGERRPVRGEVELLAGGEGGRGAGVLAHAGGHDADGTG